jgi:GAF domain-containing protein
MQLSQQPYIRQNVPVLAELDSLLCSCRSVQDVERAAKYFVPRVSPNWSAALHLLDDPIGRKADVSERPEQNRSFTAADCWALRHGRIHVTNPSDSAPLCSHLRPTSPGTHFCVPLFARREPLGILHVFERGGYGEEPSLSSLGLNVHDALAKVGAQLALSLAAFVTHPPEPSRCATT